MTTIPAAPQVITQFVQVPATLFGHLFTEWRNDPANSNAAATSEFADIPGTRYYVNGYAGYGVRSDGELVFVHSWTRGQGDAIVTDAISRGARRLDCYDGHLTTLYGRHGFVVTAREPNWTPGGPDVVWMTYLP